MNDTLYLTFYHRPRGTPELIQIPNIEQDIVDFFITNKIKISAEDDLTYGGFIVYGELPNLDADGNPVEVIVFSKQMDVHDTLKALRTQIQTIQGRIN